jgi:L-rhamnose mutarotase
MAKTFGFTINLKDDPHVIEKYKAYHRAVWPEVLESAHKKGIFKSRIFLLGRRLFMYFETSDDYDPARDLLPDPNPRCKEWDDLMRSFQEPVPEAQSEEWWAEMELVFEDEM